MPNSTTTFESALEFDVFLRRGIRRGVFDLAELFAALMQHAQSLDLPCIDPSRIELLACMQALKQLPPLAFGHLQWRLVDNLAVFDLSPASNASLCPWQALDETTLVVACPSGAKSISSLISTLCMLWHEQHKLLACLDREPQLATWLQAPLSFCDALAFALGQDNHTVKQAFCTEADGRLFAQLLSIPAMPTVHVHPSLQPSQSFAKNKRITQNILGGLAERGLLQRPVHIVIGAPIALECLSPYHRDLGPQISAWGDATWQMQKKNRPRPFHDDPDGSYLLQADFLAQDPALVHEKHLAERRVGIQHASFDGANVSWVDLGRLAPKACDARLPAFAYGARHQAPIILHLDPKHAPQLDRTLLHLIESFSQNLHSVSVIVDGMMPTVPEKLWYEARCLQSWDLADTICELGPEKDAETEGLFCLSVPWQMSAASSSWYLPALSQPQGALDFGHLPIARTLHNMRLLHRLPKQTALHWSTIAVPSLAYSRTELYVRAHIDCAINNLARIMIPQPSANVEPTKAEASTGPSSSKNKAPSPRAEARRIKA